MGVKSVNIISDPSLDKFDVIDTNLLPSKNFVRNFGEVNDYIESHLYTKDNRLLTSNYNVKDYKIPNTATSNTSLVNSLELDPAKSIQNLGYTVGDFKLEYRIFRKKLFTIAQATFFITEISKDRTEIGFSSNIVSDATLEENTLNFLYEIQSSQYFKDFLLNFGDNNIVNAVNIALNKNTSPYSVIVKLYKPLPAQFDLKSTLWVVEELADPIVFEVELVPDPTVEVVPFLSPANFDLEIASHRSVSSTYQSIDSIYTTSDITLYQDVINRLNNKSATINVDYTDYANFVHFSSAQQRLNNFFYKLQTLESYVSNISTLTGIPATGSGIYGTGLYGTAIYNYTGSIVVSSSISSIQTNINNIVKNMDGYEKYLFSATSSQSWPKYSSSLLYPTTSSQALTWFGSYDETSTYYGGQSYTASLYDLENQDNLVYIVPEYLAIDDANSDYLLFVNMMGQQFDEVWLYIKGMSDLHKAENSLTLGISKDMVFTALRSLGIKTYNSSTNDDIFEYFVGTSSGSYTVTGSSTVVSGEDRSKEIFKRIYHNLPTLLKSKGSVRGAQNILTTFGIPDTILSPIEYGGSDKFNSTPEYNYNRFSYALNNQSGSRVELTWAPLTQNYVKYNNLTLVPDGIELRFKPDFNNISNNVTLLEKYDSASAGFGVTLAYTSSEGTPSAIVTLAMSGSSYYTTGSTVLPIYNQSDTDDENWWTLLVRRDTKYTNLASGSTPSQSYSLNVKNKISNRVGQQGSASISDPSGSLQQAWNYYGTTGSAAKLSVGGPVLSNAYFVSGSYFNGQLQELRYWSEPLTDAVFDNHVLSNESYESNDAFSDLAARFPLGNNLVTYNHFLTQSIDSLHPNHYYPYTSGSTVLQALYGYAIYGVSTYNNTGSLNNVTNLAYFYNFANTSSYSDLVTSNTLASINSGYYGPVTDKVRIVDNTIQGNVLSPFIKLEKPDVYRTDDISIIDISNSPQNDIDRDIVAQYGTSLNIDNIIGDPSLQYNYNYSGFNVFRQNYYQKFINKINYKDILTLVDGFDNTINKVLEDNTPARSNLLTGFTIKSPVLERNRIQRFQPEITTPNYTASIEGRQISAGNSHAELVNDYSLYTGKVTGSLIDLDEHFSENNFNKYALLTDYIDTNKFEHSDFNVLYGNVSRQRLSAKFKKIDQYDSRILGDAEIQDTYYSARAYTTPRYEGCKSTSAIYNTYTVGDKSYGKNAAIDRNSTKFAYVTSINNLNFKYKTNAVIKYLIDKSGSLTDLSTHNYNLFEVQNIFKSGEDTTVSISNLTSPSNQAPLNGDKPVWKGGYSFDPILYRENNETLYFSFNTPIGQTSTNIGVKAYATSSYHYRADRFSDVIAIMGNPNAITNNDYFNNYLYEINGSSATTSGLKMSYEIINKNIWKYNTPTYPGLNYTDIGSLTRSRTNIGHIGPVYAFNLLNFNDTANGYNLEPLSSTYQSYLGGNNYYKVPRTSNAYVINANILFSFNADDRSFPGYSLFKVVGVVEKSSTPSDRTSWTYVANSQLIPLNPADTIGQDFNYDGNSNTIRFDDEFNVNSQFSLNINNATVSLTAGEYVRFQFYWIDLETGFSEWKIMDFNLNASYPGTTPLAKSYFEIKDTTTSTTTYQSTGSYGQLPILFDQSTTTLANDTITFNANAYGLFYSSSISLTSTTADYYSSVIAPLSVQPYDLFRLGSFNSPYSEYYEVKDVQTISSQVKVTFFESLNQSLYDGAQNFAFLRPKDDETSVIIDYPKNSGSISPTLLIPINLETTTKARVGDIMQGLTF